MHETGEEQEGLLRMYMVTVNKEAGDRDGKCAKGGPQALFAGAGGTAEPVNMHECVTSTPCREYAPQEAIMVTEW